MDPKAFTPWGLDWAWGLPLIALTVTFHVTGLELNPNELVGRVGIEPTTKRLRVSCSTS
jgi:hypothetical protein